jgi:hypothetical protein
MGAVEVEKRLRQRGFFNDFMLFFVSHKGTKAQRRRRRGCFPFLVIPPGFAS